MDLGEQRRIEIPQRRGVTKILNMRAKRDWSCMRPPPLNLWMRMRHVSLHWPGEGCVRKNPVITHGVVDEFVAWGDLMWKLVLRKPHLGLHLLPIPVVERTLRKLEI